MQKLASSIDPATLIGVSSQRPYNACFFCPLERGAALGECEKKPVPYSGICEPLKIRWSLILKAAGVPKRFRMANWARTSPLSQEREQTRGGEIDLFQTCWNWSRDDSHLQSGDGLIFRGAVGSGKTTLATAILQEALSRGWTGLFVTIPSMMDRIFSLRDTDREELARWEIKLRTADLVLFDDLGEEDSESWVKTKIVSILSDRFNEQKSNLISLNLDSDNMHSRYAERILDRLGSTCRVLNFAGPSLRGRTA